MFGVVYSATNGVWPSFYGEMFPTRVRLSGMAIGTQIGFAIAGFAPTFAAAIAGRRRRQLVGGRDPRRRALPGQRRRRRHGPRLLPRPDRGAGRAPGAAVACPPWRARAS